MPLSGQSGFRADQIRKRALESSDSAKDPGSEDPLLRLERLVQPGAGKGTALFREGSQAIHDKYQPKATALVASGATDEEKTKLLQEAREEFDAHLVDSIIISNTSGPSDEESLLRTPIPKSDWKPLGLLHDKHMDDLSKAAGFEKEPEFPELEA